MSQSQLTPDYQANNTGYGRSSGRGYENNKNKSHCQLCGKFGHLVHHCFERFNVHFQDVSMLSLRPLVQT